MGLVDYDDAEETGEAPSGGGECADCLKDMKEAWDSGDFEAAATAFKQAVHFATEGEPEESKGPSHGKGILAIIGKPEK